MTIQLEVAPDGLRAQLTEPAWASVVAASSAEVSGALAPLEPASPDERPDEPLAAAAALALGGAPVHVELVTGEGDRGVIAQIGCDAVATGLAVRALVAGADGAGPVVVPGVEVSTNQAANVVAEIMRLFPAAGLSRHADPSPATMPHELSLTLHEAIRTGDQQVAQLVAEQAGFESPPDVLVSLARGTTASATATIRVRGSATTVVQQWLLCDVGWVLLTIRGTQVTHTAQSRNEVADTFVRLMTTALGDSEAVSRRG
ncbi:hypothetical protein [Aeromicrobium wangtongii]|uniref:EspG family protein n=1 Tax=Aeromicrobium wangtongii TaxID=2969247 RepID=A0ABY5M8R3_9ACTN|nr:hypothetical protein [Aeromicrobium wangtongii]MCD9199888.1 hypothetical protein [Aeromicrobium wangtongii]UUP13506.1 hypothetical protein NQV15_16900 [Aeromicrobium wangtongii]